MEWIHVEEKHFADIVEHEDGSYRWVENDNCPQEPFLVGTYILNIETQKTTFEYHLVVLTDHGLESWTEDCTEILSLSVLDIEYWCKIEKP